MKVRKRMIKTAAKIYAANLILNALGTGADSDLITEEERGMLCAELERIANTIIPGIQASTLDDAIERAMK